MPLMQFRKLVLPEPLGPMIPTISPCPKVKESSSSARTAPKRSVTSVARSKSSSRSGMEPALSAVAGALPVARLAREPEVLRLHRLVVKEQPPLPLKHDAPRLQDVRVVGHLKRSPGVLLHEQDAKAPQVTDPGQRLEY